MMKVLIISHTYVTKFNQRKLNALSKYKDLKISLITPISWKDQLRNITLEKTSCSDYIIFPAKICFSGRIIWYFFMDKLFKILKSEKPDIIHIEEEPWSFVCFQVILYSKLLGLKSKIIVFTWENILRKYFFISNIIEKFVLKNINFAIAGNSEAKRVLISKGVKEGEIEVIPQVGVDISETEYKKISWLDTELDDSFTIGFIGRLVKEKGIIILIKALLKLQHKLKLLIIGDGPLKNRVHNFVRENLIEDKITIIGIVPHEEVKYYFQYMDCLVLPSITTSQWKEQFGHVIVEAFANCVPVIGSSSGSIPEVIGDAGLIFKEEDEVDLAAKIKLLIDDIELKKRLVELGKKRVQENFTNDVIAEKTYKLYKMI